MHNENRGVFSEIESFIDMLINMIAFIIAYVFLIMFEGVLYSEKVLQVLEEYNYAVLVILVLNMFLLSFTYHILNVYRPSRYMKPFRSFPEICRVNILYFGTLAVIAAFVTRPGYKEFVLFWILFAAFCSTAFLAFKRHTIKVILSLLRSKQYHLRKVIIIGDNIAAAQDYVKEVASNSQYGMMVIGYVGNLDSAEALGVDKLGAFNELAHVLDKYRPTDVIFAIDAYNKKRLIKLVNMCDDRCVKVYFLPVIYGFFKNSRQIEQIGEVPLINIHATPLDNPANAAVKRAIDILGSLVLIVLTSPLMLFAAIGVRVSSPGPIFFKQKRVGRLGRNFTMLKFRSMYVNKESNKKWTTGNDPRKTKFGTFIRKTAIDELPQLFNVLAGSMSLVGPRPEIPVFVQHFKEIVPLYMVKHYVKPGITGLAQIKGFRGDTSIEARIHEDISYIENWSIFLDIYILLQTPLKAINKNEKYSPDGRTDGEPSDEEKLLAEASKRAETENAAAPPAEKSEAAPEKETQKPEDSAPA